jgi:multidrug transporter EmrE-like cation transporter
MTATLAGAINIALTVILTVYGQLVFKWRVDDAGELPSGGGERVDYLVRLFLDPWVISVFLSALIASVTWALALTRFELSFAYPFMALSFVLVLVFGAAFLSESVTFAKVAGVLLIVLGLVVASRT